AGATEIAGHSSIEGGVMDANAVADLVDDEHPHADSTLAEAHAAGEDDMYDSDVAAVSSAESGLAVAGVADAAEAAGATASAGETGPSVLRAHPAPANSVLPRLLRVDGEGGTITGWLAKPTGQGPFPV
ncbi:S9 family peptidase, partial [Burkholderia multivorans]